MYAAWRQVLVATVVIVTLLGLGVLEVITSRLPVDRSFTARVNTGSEPSGPWQDYLLDTSTTEPASK